MFDILVFTLTQYSERIVVESSWETTATEANQNQLHCEPKHKVPRRYCLLQT